MDDRLDPHPWFAVRVRSNFERVTSLAMQAKGLEEYVPLVHLQKKWSDRLKEVEAPLFPGYVFCRFDPVRRVPVLSCPGVVSIISFDGHPVPVPDWEIQSVRKMVTSSLNVQPHPFLACGQKVQIQSGPLAGVEGLVIEVKKRFRLVVSVHLLQRSISVEIDRAYVNPVF
jgi:transcription antitermination factor NusG